jgi:zona occludens toxin (predicted ATPase)
MGMFGPVALLAAMAIGIWLFGAFRRRPSERLHSEPAAQRYIDATPRSEQTMKQSGHYVTNAFLTSSIVIGVVLAALMLFVTGIVKVSASGIEVPPYSPLIAVGMWTLCTLAAALVLTMVNRSR